METHVIEMRDIVKKFGDLVANIEKAKTLAERALNALMNGEYTSELTKVEKFGTEDWVYTLNDGKEFESIMDELYTEYRKLQKHMKLRMKSHFAERTDGYIEIWQYEGDVRGKLLVREKVESDEENAQAQCYRKAAGSIRHLLNEIRDEQQLDRRCAG